MARLEKRGSGMTERLVEIPETRDERLAAFDAWDAQVPVGAPGDWLGDALHRANAERCREILGRSRFDAPEGSAAWIAARWLAEYSTFTRCRERIAEGDTGAGCLGQMVMAAHEMGRLQAEMFWRPGADYSTGKSREALALSGRRQTQAGEQGRAMRSGCSFAATAGLAAQERARQIAAERPSLPWRAIRQILAREFDVSAETIKKTLRNPKKGG